MNLSDRIEVFARLSEIIKMHLSEEKINDKLLKAIDEAEVINPWFTKENILISLSEIAKMTEREALEKWTSAYEFNVKNPKTIAVIMAGNIPLVGFHDFLSVLISAHRIKIKLSSKDSKLLKAIIEILTEINPKISAFIDFAEPKMTDFDAVIATGSDNTSRYFDYYFGKYPHIFRRNRNSVGIIEGGENLQELELLAKDIFQYFGLGCRSVSKIYVPENYDFNLLFRSFEKYNHISQHNKFLNNYNYYRSIYLLNQEKFLENGWSIIKNESSLSSPISVLHYQNYNSADELENYLKLESDKLQCISRLNPKEGEFRFGETQSPSLDDYADNIDSMEFLLKL
jgi:hypothetical protein